MRVGARGPARVRAPGRADRRIADRQHPREPREAFMNASPSKKCVNGGPKTGFAGEGHSFLVRRSVSDDLVGEGADCRRG